MIYSTMVWPLLRERTFILTPLYTDAPASPVYG
jgi:hypothetical protein